MFQCMKDMIMIFSPAYGSIQGEPKVLRIFIRRLDFFVCDFEVHIFDIFALFKIPLIFL